MRAQESAAAEGVRKAPELEARKEAFAPTEESGFKAALATALTGPDVEVTRLGGGLVWMIVFLLSCLLACSFVRSFVCLFGFQTWR